MTVIKNGYKSLNTMSILDKSTPTQLQGGLNKDMNFQKNGDVTFALNGIRDAHDGGKYDYQSEPGNELVQSLPSGFSFMGSINGNNDEIYIFATNNVSLDTIGIFKDGKYTEVVRTTFNWNANFPITGEFRVKNGCENIIYWCNGDSPDGYFNFDRPELFKDNLNNWVPNKFKLVPDVVPPKIDLKSVNDSGGFLPLGSYYFQAEYLDESLNSIYKTDISPQTVIYDDSLGENYKQIDGGLNIAQFTEDIGGVPITNKSITLTLSNLDTQFAFVRINVARQITSVQTIDAHAVSQLIPISTDTIDWTYQGYNVSAGDYPVDYSEMITDNIRYDTAYVMEQVQGRLLRARLKQGVRDYVGYQAAATQIEVNWVAKEVNTENINELGDPKNPHTYWSCTSFQGDEVYAIGIRYLHNDGLWSPVFHIPGRPSIVNDLTLLTVVPSTQVILLSNEVWLSDVEHLGLNIGDTVERWKVFNTATVTTANQVTHPYDYEGKMGYYETDVNYPEINDCDNVSIWGTDYTGETIDETLKIRHHRFPDRRLISHHRNDGNTQYLAPYGIKFDNITYSNADIIGHQFCYVKRTDFNKTVLDSGWFMKTEDNENILYSPTPSLRGALLSGFDTSNSSPNPDIVHGTYGTYESANIMYNKNLFGVSYLKFNKLFRYDYIETAPSAEFNGSTSTPIHISYDELLKSADINNHRQNYKILNQLYTPPRSVTISGFNINVFNEDWASPNSIIETQSVLENASNLIGPSVINKTDQSYVYKKSSIVPYNNLFNLQYNYVNFNYATLTDDNVFYNGDTLITLSSVSRYTQQAGFVFRAVALNRYEEQHINTSLRYGGTNIANHYYKIDGDYQWLLSKISNFNSNNLYALIPLNERRPEYYAYNKDYDKQSIEISKSVLPITYNYCSDCLGVFDNKIVWSPKSFDEESFDLYRINKINDSISISANRGKITGLKYQNDYLLVHTENSLYILQPNPQSLATDISSVYLTTGGFLSLPPNEIVQNDIGYAGCQSKQHMCETPNGHAWCDQKRGQIFIFDTKLTELSNEQSGMTQWFKQELPSYMEYDFYQVMEDEYPYTSTYNVLNDGVGIIMYYDPRFKRLIISKKDFKPIGFKQTPTTTGDLFFDGTGWKFFTPAGSPPVRFSSVTVFENKSWTISYSFTTGNFVSWHSYRPSAAFQDSNNYYTFSGNDAAIGNIWRHNSIGNFQKFYNTKFFFIVEFMTSDFSTDNMSALHYNGYSLQWDATNKQWKNVDSTFQYGHIYNFDQSSSVFPMTLLNQETNPYGNVTFNNNQKYVIKTDNNYKVSGIYDLATASPVVTSDWTFLRNFNGYIDQLVYANNHNTSKSAYQAGNIKDKFVYCRLFYQPVEDYKKVITLLQTNETRSIR